MTLQKLFLIPIVAALFSLASPVSASPLSAVEGLEFLRRAFVGVNDFTAEITQEKQLSLMKKKMTASGTVRFKKPDTFYMELYSPYASRILLKDTTLTLKLPNEGVRQKISLPREQGLGRWISFLDRPVKSLPDGFDVRAEKRGSTVILEIAPRKKGAMREIQLSLSQDGRLKRLVLEENNRDRTVITFHRMKKNAGLTEGDFRLE
ncbi:MAG TPA: outer membrane lipoprotein carrier protein LolA [Geobacteraceae bacterium]|nr:outer membrane lipoprotein carrier protein LolA [Geobacteraceae bacterium]